MDNRNLYRNAASEARKYPSAIALIDSYLVYRAFNPKSYKLPPTPINLKLAEISEEQIAALVKKLIACTISLGLYPVVYEGENNGRLIRHVCPMEESVGEISSQGGVYDFFPHVDNPDLPIKGDGILQKGVAHSPDYLTLVCLRNEKNVRTSLILLDDVLACLDKRTISILSEPVFQVLRPSSFSERVLKSGLPVLSIYNGNYYSRFDWHNVKAMDDNKEACTALESMKEAVMNKDIWHDIFLQPGEAVTFNNQRTLHTRNAFEPRLDGSDRWLLRLFGLTSNPEKKMMVDPNLCAHHLITTSSCKELEYV